MIDKETIEYKLFKMLDDLIVDMSNKTTVNNSYPVDGNLFEQANNLLDQYACQKMRETDEGYSQKK
tara:strand:+ start:170 stop:367 length:198 start_codon:yes stop_codon:yes gene_type:complete